MDNLFQALLQLKANSAREDVEVVKVTYMGVVKRNMARLLKLPDSNYLDIIGQTADVIQRVWEVPVHGYDLGMAISHLVRKVEGLKTLSLRLMDNNRDEEIRFWSAVALKFCLTTDNCNYIAERNLLDQTLDIALGFAAKQDAPYSRTGTGIIALITSNSEQICREVIEFGVIETMVKVLEESNDVETLRNCAISMANFSMYGSEVHLEELLMRNVPQLLNNLIEKEDLVGKFYAFLAAAFIAIHNEEAKIAIANLGILDYVEPFLNTRPPSVIRQDRMESKDWLEKLVYLLTKNMNDLGSFTSSGSFKSRMKTAQIAAYYMIFEAEIQRKRYNTEIFWEIKAVDALSGLKKTSPYARKALQLMSENVYEWETKKVIDWIARVGFSQFETKFGKNMVNGEALLNLTEESLQESIGMSSILSKSFMRKVGPLKKKYDLYKDTRSFTPQVPKVNKFDVFVSYRRSNGAEFASLLRRELEVFGLTVFVDVNNLESGLFDVQLIDVIKNTAVFVLLLTPNALDRCMTDRDDWLTKEIVTALKSGCTVIPIFRDFRFPEETEDKKLPKNIRKINRYQGITWHHDAQPDCINKLEKYISQELKRRSLIE